MYNNFILKLVVILVVAFSKPTMGQSTLYDSLTSKYGTCENLSKYKFIMLGEMHFHSSQTAKVQKIVIDQVRNENKPINLFLELSPACAYYAKQYIKTGDETWLLKTESVINYKYLLKYLNGVKDSLKFNIIVIDLEPKEYFKHTKSFLESFFKDSNYAIYLKIKNAKSKNKLIKILRKECDTNFTLLNSISKEDSLFFSEELRGLLVNGFIKGRRKGKDARIREANMALILTKYYSEQCSNFLTIGRAHVEPDKLNNISSLINCLTWLNRDDIFLLTLTYSDARWLSAGKKIYEEEEFGKLIEARVFDCIFN